MFVKQKANQLDMSQVPRNPGSVRIKYTLRLYCMHGSILPSVSKATRSQLQRYYLPYQRNACATNLFL